jgi:hypothetical protein
LHPGQRAAAGGQRAVEIVDAVGIVRGMRVAQRRLDLGGQARLQPRRQRAARLRDGGVERREQRCAARPRSRAPPGSPRSP